MTMEKERERLEEDMDVSFNKEKVSGWKLTSLRQDWTRATYTYTYIHMYLLMHCMYLMY
jgi:hypothetical protein